MECPFLEAHRRAVWPYYGRRREDNKKMIDGGFVSLLQAASSPWSISLLVQHADVTVSKRSTKLKSCLLLWAEFSLEIYSSIIQYRQVWNTVYTHWYWNVKWKVRIVAALGRVYILTTCPITEVAGTYLASLWKAVFLRTLSLWSGLAPAASNFTATLIHPDLDASMRAVQPFCGRKTKDNRLWFGLIAACCLVWNCTTASPMMPPFYCSKQLVNNQIVDNP